MPYSPQQHREKAGKPQKISNARNLASITSSYAPLAILLLLVMNQMQTTEAAAGNETCTAIDKRRSDDYEVCPSTYLPYLPSIPNAMPPSQHSVEPFTASPPIQLDVSVVDHVPAKKPSLFDNKASKEILRLNTLANKIWQAQIEGFEAFSLPRNLRVQVVKQLPERFARENAFETFNYRCRTNDFKVGYNENSSTVYLIAMQEKEPTTEKSETIQKDELESILAYQRERIVNKDLSIDESSERLWHKGLERIWQISNNYLRAVHGNGDIGEEKKQELKEFLTSIQNFKRPEVIQQYDSELVISRSDSYMLAENDEGRLMQLMSWLQSQFSGTKQNMSHDHEGYPKYNIPDKPIKNREDRAFMIHMTLAQLPEETVRFAFNELYENLKPNFSIAPRM